MAQSEREPSMNCVQRLSFTVVNSLETFFCRYGESIGTYPVRYIFASLGLVLLSSIGLLNFNMEYRPEKLWIPQESDYVKTLEWQRENFPQDQRLEMILYEADNVLTAQYIREMFRIQEEISALEVRDEQGNIYTQFDLCFRVPALGGSQREELLRLKSQIFPDKNLTEELDWSLVLDGNTYATFYTVMPTACLQLSILELWGRDVDKIYSLTDQQVIDDLNTVNRSATFSHPTNFTKYLSGVTRNSSGAVVSAKTALTQIFMLVNRNRVHLNDDSGNAGLSQEVDPELYEWEDCFIKTLANVSGRTKGLGVYYQAERSFGEISDETIAGDVNFLLMGNIVIFIYVQLMLGKFNMVENRPVLSLLGMLATYMAVLVSYGLCSALGLVYSPVHTILPLLMVGLGVDDMFVIVQSWNRLDKKERQLELEKRVGRTLRHAGVAITVTSMTDFAAFFIGATTILPALRSFCIYSAVGILALYLLQSTFFVAWFTFDQRRLEDHRNGLVWCYKHNDWTPNKCSQFELCQYFFDKIYSKIIIMKPIKVLVSLVTAVLLGMSIWGVTNLRQDFNPILFIPPSSYLSQFLTKLLDSYPQAGERGTVYLGALNYSQELYKIGQLCDDLESNEYVATVDSWYGLMADYTKRKTGEDIRGKTLNDSFFSDLLSDFLFSPSGSKFQTYFHFAGNLTITQPAPLVTASKFDYQHISLPDRDEQITAMDQVKAIIKSVGFSDVAAATAMEYSSWETNKVILVELTRNLILAMAAVFIMTLVLLASFPASCCVLISVTLTLINVMALMSWWELTVDIITCINLVLCIGLCVDYSAHIALHFMQVNGTRDERARSALQDMGPPVINGAFSTFLSFSFLAFSESHVFQSFFKIFFGVFIYGVFHGLAFLPVLLSILGPAPYIIKKHPSNSDIAVSSNIIRTSVALSTSSTSSDDKVKFREETKPAYVAIPTQETKS